MRLNKEGKWTVRGAPRYLSARSRGLGAGRWPSPGQLGSKCKEQNRCITRDIMREAGSMLRDEAVLSQKAPPHVSGHIGFLSRTFLAQRSTRSSLKMSV